jgi:hypothetical protein
VLGVEVPRSQLSPFLELLLVDFAALGFGS